MEPTYFVTKKAASLQVRGPSKRGYLFKNGIPVKVEDALDLQNFRARRDTLTEVDEKGHPKAVRTHGGPITGRDIEPKSYRKFGGSPASSVSPASVPTKEPEKVVRTSKPKPAPEEDGSKGDEESKD